MPSFLEQLNSQAEKGQLKSAATAPKTAQAASPAPQPQPYRAPEAQDRSVAQAAHAAAEPTPVTMTPSDIEIDHTYGRRRIKKFLIGAAVGLVVLVGLIFLIRFMTMTPIPDFRGKTVAEMQKWCTDNKMYLSQTKEYTMDTDENFVIDQSIKPGTRIGAKTTIDATVSGGPDPNEKITLPDLESMSAAEIRNWIDENKLTSTRTMEEYSDTVEKGKVIRYEFSSVSVDKDHFKRGDTLYIYISRGQSSYYGTTMQNFVGKTRTEAENWANNNRVKFTFIEELSSTVKEGYIIAQDVASGTRLGNNVTVTITVSLGAGLKVPNFAKIDMNNAAASASAFRVTVELRYSAKADYGALISQSVAAGKTVSPNENEITVVYSLGRPYMRNLVGTNEADLPQLFYDFNLKGTKLTYETSYISSSQPRGTVVWASVNSEYIAMDEHILIRISNGSGSGMDSEYVRVPDFSKLSPEEAAALDSKLKINVLTVYSETASLNTFIFQSLRAGGLAENGDEITVTYSAGRPYMPDLIGKTEPELEQIFYGFRQKGCSATYAITYVASDQPKGTVVKASKNAEYFGLHEVIEIQISKGN